LFDKNLHIRNFRQSSTPIIFEPDRTLDDENLLQFVAERDHERMLAAFAEAAANKKEKSIILQTSKRSGIELELSITFTPIYDGFGNSKEFAFVIWDLKPVDSEIDAATKLKIWMAKRDITAGHLSALTGISIQTISKLRNGKIIKPQRLTAELIASELQVGVHEIWTEIRK
jgi:DNA-binding Xre family transcriptional regulator